MKHEESNLQIECVAWFRAQYPQYAMLLIHPINEGSGNTSRDHKRQGIHKAEGAQAGVPDLLLFIPDDITGDSSITSHILGIEFKTLKGKQSQEQKDFETMFLAAGNDYRVIRTFEDFRILIDNWIRCVSKRTQKNIEEAYKFIESEKAKREKRKFYKLIGEK